MRAETSSSPHVHTVKVLSQPEDESFGQALCGAKAVEVIQSLAVLDGGGVGIGGEVAKGREDGCPHEGAKDDEHRDD